MWAPHNILVGLRHSDRLQSLLNPEGNSWAWQGTAGQENTPCEITILPLAAKIINTHLPTSRKGLRILRNHSSCIITTKMALILVLGKTYSISRLSLYYCPFLGPQTDLIVREVFPGSQCGAALFAGPMLVK